MTALTRTVRGLLRQPSYSLLVIAMLALGIAGNSAMFSLLDSLLLRPLALEDPERLVYLDQTAPDWNLELVSIAYSDFSTPGARATTPSTRSPWSGRPPSTSRRTAVPSASAAPR